jgi:hypothetical protein
MTKGIVSETLERDLSLALRRDGIVVWLDRDGHYTAFVDGLQARHGQGEFPAPVAAFRGSYIDLILQLEPYGDGFDPTQLLIHMPGHNEESVRETPLLELYRAGARYRKALTSLVREAGTGRVDPDALETFVARGDLSLDLAETWLHEQTAKPASGLAGYLDQLNPEWLVDELLSDTKAAPFNADWNDGATAAIVMQHLYRRTGLDETFASAYLHGQTAATAHDVGDVLAAWLMAVEYVFDLRRDPHLPLLQPLKRLSAPLQKVCETMVPYWRQRFAESYSRRAAAVEGFLSAEFEAISPDDLGDIDTFRREESRVLEAAIQALQEQAWSKARDWAERRSRKAGFWLQRDQASRLVWTMVQHAADWGETMAGQARPLAKAHSLAEAVEAYAAVAFQVDRAHRRYEQQRANLLNAQLPYFAQMLQVSDDLRRLYRTWADRLATDFAGLCDEAGFLPEASLQQRMLFEQDVLSLLSRRETRRLAFILVDALRFEMATELAAEMRQPGTVVSLKARLAELPTITAVGMNALPPVVKQGKLTLPGGKGFNGFKCGEFTVASPQNRIRAIAERGQSLGAKAGRKTKGIELADVCQLSAEKLNQRCGDADLIVVYGLEIDSAGEANLGPATFEIWLQQILAAWHRLKDMGVTDVVITADHGFLLQDQTTAEIAFGTKQVPDRRHVLSPEPRVQEGIVSVSLAALGYDGGEGYLLFRRDTAVFATGQSGASFVHGGNSLQERVIPVLTVSHRQLAAQTSETYAIEAETLPGAFGYHRLRLRVRPASGAQGVLTFVNAVTLDLTLTVPDHPGLRAVIKEATGAAVVNQTLQVEVGTEWVEVYFAVEGPDVTRAQVAVQDVEGSGRAQAVTLAEMFQVTAGHRKGATQPAAPTVGTGSGHGSDTEAEGWLAHLPDDGVRKVFAHLAQYGVVTEAELTNLVGSALRARQFARNLENHQAVVPFTVRVETTPVGKRYIKEQ